VPAVYLRGYRSTMQEGADASSGTAASGWQAQASRRARKQAKHWEITSSSYRASTASLTARDWPPPARDWLPRVEEEGEEDMLEPFRSCCGSHPNGNLQMQQRLGLEFRGHFAHAKLEG
jgi:hypothetical protein